MSTYSGGRVYNWQFPAELRTLVVPLEFVSKVTPHRGRFLAFEVVKLIWNHIMFLFELSCMSAA